MTVQARRSARLPHAAWAARALLTLLVAIATFASVVQAGAAFVVCAPMQRALATCCCPQAPEREERPAVERPCCEDQTVPAADRGDTSTEPSPTLVGDVVRLAAASVPPPRRALLLEEHRPTAALRLHAPARAGPGLRLHARNSVFVI